MKALIFAAMLGVSSLAFAQTEAPMTQEPTETEAMDAGTPMPAEQPMPAEMPAEMSMPSQPSAQPMPAQQPSGVTVDDPSQSQGPRGVTQQGTVPDNMSAPAGGYPPCSRTVTDSCTQTYERGRRPRR